MGVQPSKQQETNRIQDLLHELLNTFNDLKKGLIDLMKFLDEIQQTLQETLSGSVQPVEPTEPVEVFPIHTRHIAPAERKGIIHIEYDEHRKEAPVSGCDVSKDPINDVIARFLTELTSTKTPVIHRTNLMAERLHTFCNLMKDFLEENTPDLHFKSNETKVKRILTDPQSTRPKTNLEEGRIVRVQIYMSKNANLREDIMDNLYKLLRRAMSKTNGNGVKLQIDTCKTSIDIDYRRPLIVLCPVASRLGACVSDAVSGVQPDENVILLMLHHVARHDMNILSSTSKLTLPEFMKLGCILDMVFHSKDGIHICKQNDDTVARIAEFISEYKSK